MEEHLPHTDAHMNVQIPQDRQQIAYCDNLVIFTTPHGFMVDFYQANPHQHQEGETVVSTGLVVARLHIPHGAMGEMVEVLTNTWQNYVSQSMPKEINDG